MELTVAIRDALGADSGFRPSFLGHLLVEVLLDASLMADDPDLIEAYHRTVNRVDPEAVQRAVNRMAPRSTDRLAWLISAFCRERILSDYMEDGKLMERIAQVMRRVKLPQLPGSFREVLPGFRQLVDARKEELLDGIPVMSDEPNLDESNS